MKKVLALVLASTMALGMAVTSFAAEKTKIQSFISGRTLGYCVGDSIDLGDVVLDYDNQRKETIKLVKEMFATDTEGKNPLAEELTAKLLKDSKAAVRVTYDKGSKVIDSVELKEKDKEIVIKFVEEWISTGEQDFDFTVYLSLNGKRQSNEGVTFTGTFKNDSENVDAGYEEYDMSNGTVIEADEFVSKIELDLGNGVTMITKLFKGKKYFGIATMELTDADAELVSKTPAIDNVIYLKTVGLNAASNIVKLDVGGDYFVYDSEMNYLGKSNENLPYSTKYYLATSELEVEDEEEPEEVEGEDEETNNAETGGDDDVIENVNANPGTGC